jgi:hypothetical protein
MTEQNNAFRSGLSIAQPMAPVSLTYTLIPHCTFHETVTPIVGSTRDTITDFKMKPVNDQFLLVIQHGAAPPDTMVIARNGHLIGFNYASAVSNGNARVSADNQAQNDDELIQRIRESRPAAPSPHAINEGTVYFPEYQATRLTVGAPAAIIRSEDRAPWATMRFMGVTRYGGKTAAVLDIEREMAAFKDRGPILIGMSIVDLRTSMPLLTVLDVGSHLRFEQIGCDT